jgi:tetratricopeptide (TPR) repeat protein
MSKLSRITTKMLFAVIAGAFVAGGAYAQEDERAERDAQKTKQAQAVSKEVYDKIQKAQEQVDAKDYQGALRALNSLYNPDKLTEYEQANVLNYIGFVYYNMEDIPNAIRTYERMILIPSLEPQMAKQTTYTLAQLYTMEENYQKALQTLDKWFL